MVRMGESVKTGTFFALILRGETSIRFSILLDSWAYSLAGWKAHDLRESIIRDQDPSTTRGGPSRLWRPVSEELSQ